MFLNFAVINIYFFGLYNSSQIKGNPIMILIMFGIAEAFGILFGEKLLHQVVSNASLAMAVSLVIILGMNTYIKYGDLSENAVLIFFLIFVFFIGNAFNLIFTVQAEQINPKLIGIAFEINYSFGQITTMACPIIAKMDEPYPTIYCSFLCIFAILLMASMSPP